jgi:hypothetical protein
MSLHADLQLLFERDQILKLRKSGLLSDIEAARRLARLERGIDRDDFQFGWLVLSAAAFVAMACLAAALWTR